MQQNFRRTHQMLLETAYQLCCTWTASWNPIKQPCRMQPEQRPLLSGFALHLPPVKPRVWIQHLKLFPAWIILWSFISSICTHLAQDAGDQLMSYFFLRKFTFSNEVAPWRCASLGRSSKAEMIGNPNWATDHGTVTQTRHGSESTHLATYTCYNCFLK